MTPLDPEEGNQTTPSDVELREKLQRELLQKLFERVPVMLVMWGRDTRIVRVNAEVERILGWTQEDARRIDLIERSLPDQEYREKIRSYMLSLEPGWQDLEMLTKGGDRILTSWSNVVLSDDTHVGIGIDVSERRRYEEQASFLAEAGTILSSSLDYEKTLQAVADLVVPKLADWCSVHIIRDGQVQAVGLAHADPDKVIWARELQEKYPFDVEAPQGAANVLRTGLPELYPEVHDELLVLAAKDEEHLRIMRQLGFRSVLVVPLKARGQVLGSLSMIWSETERHYSQQDVDFVEQLARKAAIAIDNSRLYGVAEVARRDLQRLNESLEQRVEERTEALASINEELRAEIGEREAAERALEQANRLLQQRNRELQDFAYVASHDLKEPLRKVQTFAELIQSEYSQNLEESALNYLERMQTAANRMSSLIDDLLSFSRVATAGEPFSSVDLSRIAADVLQDLELRVQESQAQIHLGELPVIDADPTQMRQLLQNLISNALKFTRDGVPPVVDIHADILKSERGRGDVVRLTVRDNGIGFEQKFAERIFAPFQRLHGRATYEGTGIGLSICRRIAERHGGTITAAGKRDKGSTFTVILPLRQNG